MSKSSTITSIVEASRTYQGEPAHVERAKAYLREREGRGPLPKTGLVDFIEAMPAESTGMERAEAALAFLGVYFRGEW